MVELLSTFYKIILMMLGFSMLVFVHELGHFVAAKWAGIRTEGFAIGMGPVALSFRKGVGLRIGSTHQAVVDKTGRGAHQLSEDQLNEFGLGETEYSLRFLPLGGFVKMLGQEDGNPSAVSADPRSYTQCSIFKRMVVVSAGVVMNLIFAALLFMVVFAIGVPMPAPIVGQVRVGAPASTTTAENAVALGIAEPGLMSGDRVIRIDDEPVHTFADIEIAAALGRDDQALDVLVERPGYSEPLRFAMTPQVNGDTGRLYVGIAPALTTTIAREKQRQELFVQSAWPDQGLEAGMRLTSINGNLVSTLTDVNRVFASSDGSPLSSSWQPTDESGADVGTPLTLELRPEPGFMPYLQSQSAGEFGLLGLTPLVEVKEVSPGSPNADVLQTGDVILRLGSTSGPRRQQVIETVQRISDGTVPVSVLRDGAEVEFELTVSRGRIGILMGDALETPRFGQPIDAYAYYDDSNEIQEQATAARAQSLLPLTTIVEVNGTPVEDWRSIWSAIVGSVQDGADAADAGVIEITVEHPTEGRERERVTLSPSEHELMQTAVLSWRSPLSSVYFEEAQVVRKAEGNPLQALGMGVEETKKALIQTYLTLDRVIRGSVSVKELRGPVGIVHVGVTIFDRGWVYLLLLLAVISVNLAVINFLPLPIVDGGLFLFLIYERIKGRPPSIAFQNIVTICGLCMIGALFVMVTFNDILRLFT